MNFAALDTTNGNDKHTVDFEPSDPHNPQNWSFGYKLLCTTIIWLLAFITGWASAVDSVYNETGGKDLHVSKVAETLATSMYLFGVGAGAVFVGPCSETIGRLPTYLLSFAIYLVWIMATALSPNYAAQIIFRLFAGLSAAASMSIYGGSLADLFEVRERALWWPFFALSPLLGPTIAPIAGGWISEYLGWRWVDWVTLIISGAIFLFAAVFLPETFSPILLSFKARFLRQATGDESYQSEHDPKSAFVPRLKDNLHRIVYFIFREPTTLLFELYLTLLYILIYGFLEGFEYIFTRTYHFSVGYRYTSFCAIVIGILLALPYVVLLNRTFGKTSNKSNQNTPPPEQRLGPAIFASPLLPISLFWIGWTNRPDVSYWSNLGACCLFGFAVMALFASTYHYLLDSYGTDAASAMAAITFVRYFASGGMVLATGPMYSALTVKWTLTLLGCVAALLTPVPLVFWRFGATIREKSKWAKT